MYVVEGQRHASYVHTVYDSGSSMAMDEDAISNHPGFRDYSSAFPRLSLLFFLLVFCSFLVFSASPPASSSELRASSFELRARFRGFLRGFRSFGCWQMIVVIIAFVAAARNAALDAGIASSASKSRVPPPRSSPLAAPDFGHPLRPTSPPCMMKFRDIVRLISTMGR
ncbi:hypothetical protein O6H91_23G035400 [Diphasiastrum complanatum]|uniref:Uncharacterized protein n=1 Tax=Diphasiastrum complanatum TaxID=34168 RepID=A0ACC2A9M6_DIPCM|nr:hypothetical protein O6H91_23G035400 [Diphasiastrum complanatum]